MIEERWEVPLCSRSSDQSDQFGLAISISIVNFFIIPLEVER